VPRVDRRVNVRAVHMWPCAHGGVNFFCRVTPKCRHARPGAAGGEAAGGARSRGSVRLV
jgi:hypothetical protein